MADNIQKQKVTDNIKTPSKNLEILKKNFSHCFDKEGDFDFDKFKKELSKNEDIDFSDESYGMDWLGKSYARLLASDEARTLLKEDEEWNSKKENKESENLLLKGDNLEILKHLSNAYYEKIKMIYIDPPYNTGSDGFVYEDDRKFNVEELSKLAGISYEEAKRILDFTQSKSNSHSAWLTFIYPRLYIAQQLLKEEGVIFVSIDDNEVAQLRLLLDEIFGEENFVAEFPRITKKAGKTTDAIAKNTDYLICYQNTEKAVLKKNTFEDSKYDGIDEYNKERGNFKLSQTLDYGSIQYSKSLDYEIELNGKIFRPGNATKSEMNSRRNANPKSDYCWRWSKELFEFGLKEGFVVVKNDRIYTKTYKNAVIKKGNTGYFVHLQKRKKATSTLEFIENKYSNDNAKKDISKYFNEKVFEYSKPTSLVYKIAEISTDSDDIILDFFAGSGTTADAIMQLNANDDENRKYILVQLPEEIDKKKNKSAYEFVKNELKIENPTIFDITKERIVRAGKKIIDDNNKLKKSKDLSKVDFGFKVFETIPNDEGHWEEYILEAESFDKQQKLFDESKLNSEDLKMLITSWKTYDGLSLTQSLSEIDLEGYKGYYSDNKLYLVDRGFKTKNLKKLLEEIDANKDFNPATIIVFGYNFDSKTLREIADNVKSYTNKKKIDIDFITRY